MKISWSQENLAGVFTRSRILGQTTCGRADRPSATATVTNSFKVSLGLGQPMPKRGDDEMVSRIICSRQPIRLMPLLTLYDLPCHPYSHHERYSDGTIMSF
ncbi:hypothetical protein EDD11_000512 [Mortierella claussenii]|nr:hypothetical protein EDD11_000512 [Mortierella claussenii]